MTAPAVRQGHADLMDRIYRRQRHIYDATRKFYLFGRDRALRALAPPDGGSVLEIGCGTGRNLAMVHRLWPQARLYGIDISNEMLKSARARLGPRARLEQADATAFDAESLFGRGCFDRVIMAYCTSMIPRWQQAVAEACWLLAPGGSLHIVDFGPMDRMPGLMRRALLAWLVRFHVMPRGELAEAAMRLAAARGLSCTITDGPGSYYQCVTLARPSHAPL